MALDWGKMYGPLPLGGWVAAVAGGLVIMQLNKNSSGGNATGGYSMISNSTQDGVGEGGSGMWVDINANTPTSVGYSEIANNEDWIKASINYLISEGYDGAAASNALNRYVTGYELNDQEAALLKLAMIKLGAPPSPVSTDTRIPTPKDAQTKPTYKYWRDRDSKIYKVAPDGSSTYVSWAEWVSLLALNNGKAPELKPDLVRKNTSTPKPVASPAKQRTYRVVKGDTLARIGKKYGKSWQSIYNANRNIVKNPNRIYPGQVLQIPN